MKQGVLITRPQPLAERTAAAVAALGYEPYICPLLQIVPLVVPSVTATYDGAIFTSATVFGLGLDLGLPADLPLYLVGAHTKSAAAEAGFMNIRHCVADVTSLAAWFNRQGFSAPQSLVYYCGVHQAHDLQALVPPAVRLHKIPVYESQIQQLTEFHRDLLLAGAVHWILLYSRRTAAALAAAIEGLDDKSWCAGTSILCLSSAVLDPLSRLGWRSIQVAETPDEPALLARLQEGWFERNGEHRP